MQHPIAWNHVTCSKYTCINWSCTVCVQAHRLTKLLSVLVKVFFFGLCLSCAICVFYILRSSTLKNFNQNTSISVRENPSQSHILSFITKKNLKRTEYVLHRIPLIHTCSSLPDVCLHSCCLNLLLIFTLNDQQ